MIPPAAIKLLPVLALTLSTYWPDAPYRSAVAAQIEQETCVTPTHRFCWSPYAELKTSREYGFGLGQLTVTSRFNRFDDARFLHPVLRQWRWEDRFDAKRQLIAVVLMDKGIFQRIEDAANPFERAAFTFAAYNGGEGGLRRDRLLCDSTPGCDSSRWFGHTEKTSWRAKTATQGYGKSFFEINREYVRNILIVRRPKYVPHVGV